MLILMSHSYFLLGKIHCFALGFKIFFLIFPTLLTHGHFLKLWPFTLFSVCLGLKNRKERTPDILKSILYNYHIGSLFIH